MLQNVYISLPYIVAARTVDIDSKKLRHCQTMYSRPTGYTRQLFIVH